jgi:hypothetical protein
MLKCGYVSSKFGNREELEVRGREMFQERILITGV